jgi:hypothetical protein
MAFFMPISFECYFHNKTMPQKDSLFFGVTKQSNPYEAALRRVPTVLLGTLLSTKVFQ